MNTLEARLKPLMIGGLDGDTRAWREFPGLLRPAFHAYFKRRQFHGDADVEDLVQEALMAVHAKRETWRRADPVTSWCYTIARYKLIDHLRKTGRARFVQMIWSAPFEVVHPLCWSEDQNGWSRKWPGSVTSRKRSSPSCGRLIS